MDSEFYVEGDVGKWYTGNINKDAVRDISKFNAEEIIYISCNPKTLVVDLQGFESYGYEVKKVRCMDMFPNTPHCETVVLLQRKDK